MNRRGRIGRWLLLAAIVLTSFGVLAAGQPVQAASGNVAFVGGDGVVKVVSAGNSDSVSAMLDSSGGSYREVKWSPNGRYLAAARSGSAPLVIFDTATGNRAEVRGISGARNISWAQRSTTLAFDNGGELRGNGSSFVYTVNADGGGLRQVAAGFLPSWSPSQRLDALFYLGPQYIAARADNCVYKDGGGVPSIIYLSDLRVAKLFDKPIPIGVKRGIWSPDGETLAFGNSFYRLSDGRKTGNINPGDILTWSPDNSYLVWADTADGPEGRENVYYAQLHLYNLATKSDRIILRAERRTTAQCVGITAKWSETGDRLVFSDYTPDNSGAIWFVRNTDAERGSDSYARALLPSSYDLLDVAPYGDAVIIGGGPSNKVVVLGLDDRQQVLLGEGIAAAWQPLGLRVQPQPTPIAIQPTRERPGGPAPTAVPRDTYPQPSLGNNRPPASLGNPPFGLNNAYYLRWAVTDQPVYEGAVKRSWVWGPNVLWAVKEPYSQGPNGQREVVYFDKGRMEINDPNAAYGKYYVSSGLLVNEMVNAYVQIGYGERKPKPQADIPVAGPGSPVYALFGPLTGGGAERTDQAVNDVYSVNGELSQDGTLGRYSRYAYFEQATNHNIPSVFWNYLNQNGVLYQNGVYGNGQVIDWVYVMGYPITDAYWVNANIDGQTRPVLVQLYERRTLTYDPAAAAGWQVQMGNVGKDYLRWRYNR